MAEAPCPFCGEPWPCPTIRHLRVEAPATGLREIAAHWRRQADLAPHEAATFRHCADEMDAALAATLDARPSGDEALRPWSPDLDECPNCGYSDPDWGLRAAAPVSPSPDVEATIAAILFGAVDDETFDRVIAVLREEPHA